MRRTVEGVVWDLDGTLVDSSIVVPDAFVAAAVELGAPPCGRADAIAGYALGPPPAVLAHLLQRSATSDDVDVYHRHLARTVSSVRAYPGIEETLGWLGERFPMAVFTGASRGAAEMLLDHSGLGRFFSHVVSGDDTEYPKPHPDGLHRVSVAMGIEAGQLVYVGDSPLDGQAARRAGAHAVAAAWGHLHRADADVDLVCTRPSDILVWEPITVRAAG